MFGHTSCTGQVAIVAGYLNSGNSDSAVSRQSYPSRTYQSLIISEEKQLYYVSAPTAFDRKVASFARPESEKELCYYGLDGKPEIRLTLKTEFAIEEHNSQNRLNNPILIMLAIALADEVPKDFYTVGEIFNPESLQQLTASILSLSSIIPVQCSQHTIPRNVGPTSSAENNQLIPVDTASLLPPETVTISSEARTHLQMTRRNSVLRLGGDRGETVEILWYCPVYGLPQDKEPEPKCLCEYEEEQGFSPIHLGD
ncbi:hypothetical protein BGZ60DRAFT_435815 [Tricladium varicosporioides]|nr:hypothetical protein BGZ60DRAFT_435815 [Hymenoscyphus varicosporioides]